MIAKAEVGSIQGTSAHPVANQNLFRKCMGYVFNISFRQHLFISIVLRLVLIYYGHLQDAYSEVPYTDIDYKVVTDGARQVLSGHTPFARHTYRYSPIMAYLQLPNVLLHTSVGKVIYSGFDLLVALLIYAVVRSELRTQYEKAVQLLMRKFGKTQTLKDLPEINAGKRPENIARASACFWLYNPLTAVISTRGNGDSFSSFFVILTIYLLLKSDENKQGCNWLIFAAGVAHGFAIHLRLYPLLFSLAYFLCLSDSLACNIRTFLRQLVLPNKNQLLLILGTAFSLVLVTGYFYRLYGWQYLYEAYLYHFVRKDVRHNFSLYFLMQYLSSSGAESVLGEKLLILAPQIFLLLYMTFSFGQFRQTLPFCIFGLAFIMVTFNSVVTSQYFVWYLSLLPLCLNNLQSISLGQAAIFFTLWLTAQGLWLLPAYLLEFKTWNTFYWIGLQGAFFFIINNYLLARMIEFYSFTRFKVNVKKLL